MYSKLTLPRQWSRFSCACRYSKAVEVVSETNNSYDIKPPPRIKRGPTDLLQALATTVGNDPTAAHYKYHDDPYLIPLSNFRKRAYALSAEAGRKAAAWVRDEHAELFTTRVWDPPEKKKTPHFNADPHIPSFAPKTIFNDETKVSEEDLQYTIKNALVEDSVKVFQLLGGVGNVNEELKLSLLQLLSFYNEKESESVEWLEERWFASNSRERQSTTWRLGGLADQIFSSLEVKNSQAYCSIIQGMAKYYQAERALQLTQEALESGLILSTSVYNSLIGCVGFLKEGTSLRTEALQSFLHQMEEQGLSPNLGTLNACLRSIAAWGSGAKLQQFAIQIIAEFRAIGIEPGLSAYYYLLCLFCKERGPRTDILTTILNDLEKRPTIEANEPTDTNFFITAMSVCSEHLQNMALAERVHALLMKDDNYKLVGDAYKESIYYRHLVTVACRHAPLERTTQFLDELVPNIYVPEPSVMEEIIRCLELGGAGDRLAQAWSQLVIFGIAHRTRILEKLLDAICNCYQFQDEEVKIKMRTAAADILKFRQIGEEDQQNKENRTPPKKLAASALCNIIELCSDVSGESEDGWITVSDAVTKLQHGDAIGVPAKPAVLEQVACRAAAAGKPTIASMIISYLAECGFEEASSASVKVLSTFLNRPGEEVLELLKEPRSSLVGKLDNTALAVADAYMGITSDNTPANTSSSSGSSDSEDSSEDELN